MVYVPTWALKVGCFYGLITCDTRPGVWPKHKPVIVAWERPHPTTSSSPNPPGSSYLYHFCRWFYLYTTCGSYHYTIVYFFSDPIPYRVTLDLLDVGFFVGYYRILEFFCLFVFVFVNLLLGQYYFPKFLCSSFVLLICYWHFISCVESR
ncbi:uncharacterized protein N7469_005493 [Penicillium citrinum]|uniref:Uncharacterized protein n=1 Tax=Penicillium citrinum TaxID=5077 RepID=A0A9W9P404_PENCI|nr:uncharacterized protein N7469_005493 [Penicillium citrinum]KAJ5233727.1 hypothetical protein N7469_005493 [Penicillium citrinum]